MTTVLKVENFSKNYGKFSAVKNISFQIEKGEIIGFVGKNGAGKSTTLRCIINMLFPSEGHIEILGLDSVKNAKAIKSKVSYLPSETEFYNGITAYELFKFSSRFSASNFDEAIKLATFFELDLKKKVSELSLGNRKKISIIIALMKDAELIIMDEPTSGLDPLMQNNFFDIIKEKAKNGCTILLSSHNLNEVQKYCDRALIIKDGEIADNIDIDIEKTRNKQVVTFTTMDDETISFDINEDINDLIKGLSKINLKSLEIESKSIEEELLDSYEGGNDNE